MVKFPVPPWQARVSAPTGQKPLAPHVQAAVSAVQPKAVVAKPVAVVAPPASPFQTVRAHPPGPTPTALQPAMPSGPANVPVASSALSPEALCLSPQASAALERYAPHVRTAVLAASWPQKQPLETRPSPSLPTDYVIYTDKKSFPDGPVPPPRKPVYRLSFDDKGKHCRLHNLKTGQVTAAGTLFAGFVRMQKNGAVYISPRTTVGMAGDGHPTIASQTPEWMGGQRYIVAAGEVGIINGEIVGHNDKTGHYQSRKNPQQSGLPSDKFYSYTVDPRQWYLIRTLD